MEETDAGPSVHNQPMWTNNPGQDDARAETAAPAFVYALGRIEPRFPSLGVEKEFAQATGRAATIGLSDRQAAHAVLVDPANRYLVRKLCWVFAVESQDTYIIVPRDSTDLDLLVEAVRPNPASDELDLLIGRLGPLAPPEYCNGLVVPLVAVTQAYSFSTSALIQAIPRPENMSVEQFEAASHELFSRVRQMADNAGAFDDHRALNYLVVRHPRVYTLLAAKFEENAQLAAVDVIPSRLAGIRRLVEVVFSFADRTSGATEKFAVRVDVTEDFPFVAGTLGPYYAR